MFKIVRTKKVPIIGIATTAGLAAAILALFGARENWCLRAESYIRSDDKRLRYLRTGVRTAH